jgi:hypothetical protein
MSEGASRLAADLVGGRHADGGWPYYRGKASRLEPTAWAVLALAKDSSAADPVSALVRWPHDRGLLIEHAGGIPNYTFHALALLALAHAGVEHQAGTAALLAALGRVRGIPVEGSFGKRQDNTLLGWSWIAESFSWAEPTAWALLALKKLRKSGAQVDTDRIDQGERLMINRSCVSGGWNYGNADANGQDLRPYVPTTAVGVLAMQDRSEPEVARSVEYLEQHATSEQSGSALSLAAIALGVSRRNTAPVRAALDKQLDTTLEFGNLAVIASALVALTSDGSHAAFAL